MQLVLQLSGHHPQPFFRNGDEAGKRSINIAGSVSIGPLGARISSCPAFRRKPVLGEIDSVDPQPRAVEKQNLAEETVEQS